MMRALLTLTILAALLHPASAHEPEPESNTPAVLAWERAIYGPEDAPIRVPVALASAAVGELVVADLDPPRLRVFRETEARWVEERAISLPAAPASLTARSASYALSVRGNGAVYTLERKSWALRQLALPRGSFAGAVAADADDMLLVHDQVANRVLRLDPSGKEVASVDVGPALRGLVAVGGGFLGVFPSESMARRYAWAGGTPDELHLGGVSPRSAWPVSMIAAAQGGYWLLDRHGGRVVLVSDGARITGSGSRRGRAEGLLFYPSGLALIGSERLAVADQGNGRVQLFRVIAQVESP